MVESMGTKTAMLLEPKLMLSITLGSEIRVIVSITGLECVWCVELLASACGEVHDYSDS